MKALFEIVKNLPPYILFTLSIVAVVLGDYFGKKWSIDQKNLYFLIACLAFLASGFFYFPILLKQGLVTSSLLWTILSIIAFLIIGFVVFHETVSGLQVVGIIFGIISVIILSI